jgi:hypothetical protein
MTLAAIRALFETEITTAYSSMAQPAVVVYDNVQEIPPADASGGFVILSIAFAALTDPLMCPTEGMIDHVRGTVQLACYAPRAQGMRRLEELATVGSRALVGIKAAAQTFPGVLSGGCGEITGPEAILSGDAPHALVTLAAPFQVRT